MGRPPRVRPEVESDEIEEEEEEEVEEEEMRSGSVVWGKLENCPWWWPGVVFETWDQIDIDWCLPMREESLRPHVGDDQYICVFLQNYNFHIFYREDPCLAIYHGPDSCPLDDEEEARQRNGHHRASHYDALGRQYQKALADASRLYIMQQTPNMEVEDIALQSSLWGSPSIHRLQELSRWLRASATLYNESLHTANQHDEIISFQEGKQHHLVSPPKSWGECIEMLVYIKPEHGFEIKIVIERAIILAQRHEHAYQTLADALRKCLDTTIYDPDDAGESRLQALSLLEAEIPEKYQDELVTEQGRIYANRRRQSIHTKKSLDPLARAVTQGFIKPGPLVLEQSDGKVIAQLTPLGRIKWLDETFHTLDQFVEAARKHSARAYGNRPMRSAHAKRDRDRVLHQISRQPLSQLIENALAKEHEVTDKIANGEYASASAGLTPTKNTSVQSREKSTSPVPITVRKRYATAAPAAAPPPTKKKPAAIKKTTSGTKRKAEAVTGGKGDLLPEALEEDPLENETPLSQYWLTEDTSTSTKALGTAMASVWDDGFFTDDDAEAKVKKTATKNSLDNNAAAASNSNARRETIKKREKRLRLNRLVEGLNGKKLDPHALVNCESYDDDDTDMSNIDTSEDEKQPFGLFVHPDAAFLCDLHAHLAEAEIIGLLGGRWDPQRRCMHIQAPFPCRATQRDDDGATDVEMDPASELQVREVITRHDMDVVGWYHSHPQFASEPSVTDIENQRSYQTLFRQEATGVAPFIGLIVGTYDPNNPSPCSTFRYFHVAAPPERFSKAVSSSNSTSLNGASHQATPLPTAPLVASNTETNLDSTSLPEPPPQEGRDEPIVDDGFVIDEALPATVPSEEIQPSHIGPDSSTSSKQQRALRKQRTRTTRDEAPTTRRSQTPSMIPMALKAKIRAYRWGLDDDARRARREANGKLDPPLSHEVPFSFANRCNFKCTCCPPLDSSQGMISSSAAEETKSNGEAQPASYLPTIEQGGETPRNDVAVPLPQEESSDLDSLIKSIVQSVKAKIQKAKKSGGLDEKGLWSKIFERYGHTHLGCVAHTVRQLGKYYCRHERRVELTEHWRKDITKWDKLLHSLSSWTLKMAIDPEKRVPFLTDLMLYMHVCWRTKPKARKKQHARRR